jgi:hypothetical protein
MNRLPRRAGIGPALLSLTLASSPLGAADEPGNAGSTRRSNASSASQERPRMWMTVGTQRFAVTPENNPTARAFAQLLPATFDMIDLHENEKYVRMPRSLPTNPVRPGTVRAGDVMLYGNDTLVVFYETFESTYSYTRIGRIAESGGLAQALGRGNARVAFAMP